MKTMNANDSPAGLKTELCLTELILFVAKHAVKRGDCEALSDLEGYITQSYLTLGYTETDYVVTLREYIEALRLSLQGADAQDQIDRMQQQIINDMQELIVAHPEELGSLFSVDSVGTVTGLCGRIGGSQILQ